MCKAMRAKGYECRREWKAAGVVLPRSEVQQEVVTGCEPGSNPPARPSTAVPRLQASPNYEPCLHLFARLICLSPLLCALLARQRLQLRLPD